VVRGLSPFEVEVRRSLLAAARAAIHAVLPEAAVARELKARQERTPPFDATVILGLGKAAVAMAKGASAVAVPRARGAIVTPTPEPVGNLEVLRGAHPVPDEGSLAGGRRLLELAREVGPQERAVVLISGGGSAVAVAPAPPLTLSDVRAVHEQLLLSGATIDEMNAVRKHLSAFKGGRLGEALGGAGDILTLVLSDVIGSPLDVIASGPTVPDPTTYEDAWAVLERRGLTSAVPLAVQRHLREGRAGLRPESPKGGPVFDRQQVSVIGSGAVAAEAARRAIEQSGGTARVVRTDLAGEAREVARALVRAATGPPELTQIYAGETTVTVRGDGCGGRNQELALAASIELGQRRDVVLLAIGTDGIDGLSPAAGAFAGFDAVGRGRAVGLDARAHLEANDSHPFLTAIDDVVTTGATGTNVGDLILVQRIA
jgi:hydroxypyruvate reductase